jgi:hypothetical protein
MKRLQIKVYFSRIEKLLQAEGECNRDGVHCQRIVRLCCPWHVRWDVVRTWEAEASLVREGVELSSNCDDEIEATTLEIPLRLAMS